MRMSCGCAGRRPRRRRSRNTRRVVSWTDRKVRCYGDADASKWTSFRVDLAHNVMPVVEL